MKEATNKKTKVGVVVSNAMNKSIVVEVVRTVIDPRFKKYLKKKNKFMAHDEKEQAEKGDTVLIEECRPLSKRKSWKLREVVTKASQVE